MKLCFLLLISLYVCILSSCSKPEFQIEIKETGVYNIVLGNDLIYNSHGLTQVTIPVQIYNASEGSVTFEVFAEDMLGLPIKIDYNQFTVKTEGKPGAREEIALELKNGFYRISIQASNNDEQYDMGFTEIAIVPPQAKGLRPNSFFASNTSEIKTGNDLALLDLLGIKVQRTHFYPETPYLPEMPRDKALTFDYTILDQEFEETVGKGIWVLPIAGYAFPGTRSEMAIKMNNHGPPRHFKEFSLSWQEIIREYPEIRVYELWNEPWIFEWTWAATAEEYRELQKMWCHDALEADPDIRIIAGNSCMFVEDNIEPYPEIWEELIHGTSHHPYANAEARSLRHNAQIRSIDYGYLVNSRMNLPYYYITEGGSLYSTPNHIAQAAQKMNDLYRQLIRQENGSNLVAGFDRYRQLHAQIKFNLLGHEHLTNLVSQKSTLKQELQEYALNNGKTRDILNRLFEAFYITLEDEIGTANNSNVNASKVVQYTVFGALHGAYQNNIQWNLGYGPQWTRSNMTMAVSNYFLEDRPIVADIWPETSLIYGAVFAHPKHITSEVQQLTRSTDLRARWEEEIPEDALHQDLKVAVLYTLTGREADSLDTHGTLTISSAEHLRAFDCMGREINRRGNKLVVPFNEYPVYITTTELSITELKQTIANAEIDNITTLNFYANSLTLPAGKEQVLLIKADNHINRPINGQVSVYLDGKQIGSNRFTAYQGLNEILLSLEHFEQRNDNLYPIEIIIESDAGNYRREQIIQRALFTQGTRIIDGNLDDWEGVEPVLLDSDMLRKGIELTQFLFNPHLERPDQQAASDARVAARVFTSYDDEYIYIAAEVLEEELYNSAGTPALVNNVETGFKNAMPGGLNHPRYTGDMFMFGFGFRDRVPEFGRQMDDPLAWKGQFYDTDYLYMAYTSDEGDQLIRQWGADTPRQNGFQTDPVDYIGPVDNAQIVIQRNESQQTTIYEMAIPLSELELFNQEEETLRFGFVLLNNEGAGPSGKLQWSEAAGVFDYWLNSGSFAPTWDQFLPLQTEFGIAK